MATLLVGISVVLSTADVGEVCSVVDSWLQALYFDLCVWVCVKQDGQLERVSK